MTAMRIADICVWGPLMFAEDKPKWVRVLALVVWWPWFLVCFPVFLVAVAIVVWREI